MSAPFNPPSDTDPFAALAPSSEADSASDADEATAHSADAKPSGNSGGSLQRRIDRLIAQRGEITREHEKAQQIIGQLQEKVRALEARAESPAPAPTGLSDGPREWKDLTRGDLIAAAKEFHDNPDVFPQIIDQLVQRGVTAAQADILKTVRAETQTQATNSTITAALQREFGTALADPNSGLTVKAAKVLQDISAVRGADQSQDPLSVYMAYAAADRQVQTDAVKKLQAENAKLREEIKGYNRTAGYIEHSAEEMKAIEEARKSGDPKSRIRQLAWLRNLPS